MTSDPRERQEIALADAVWRTMKRLKMDVGVGKIVTAGGDTRIDPRLEPPVTQAAPGNSQFNGDAVSGKG